LDLRKRAIEVDVADVEGYKLVPAESEPSQSLDERAVAEAPC
jgi:hypothetical protein